ncbi:riboflavin synthase domain-like protein [Gymnopus androsaceus JB14]|uniref:NADPH-dependent diflavin oxidoreductase 1 n=1 Tax=Gymnopus androsaceus JB14 TaxID=1447944 RepID=A0A6A4GKQ9_9AGAR|nr:riboflavin synthase domain-like protein [Gymnopus androsaceus JB14]
MSFDLDPRKALILYATETGTAQEIANRVARQCRRIHVKSRVLSMDAYSAQDLVSEDLVIFIVSTTGSGVEPRSMTVLWNMLLRSDLPEDLFEDMHFTVFGLGDTAYEKFCWPAKRLTRRLESLGAVKFYEVAEGDEQHLLGIDGALEPWLEALPKALLQIMPLPHGHDITPQDQTPPSRVTLANCSESQVAPIDPWDQDQEYHTATVKCNTRITAQNWFQDVRHLEFDLEDDVRYSPGDVAVIHPVADADDVENFLSSMGWGNSADDLLEIKHVYQDQSLPDNLPRFASLRTIFSRYLDFNAVPRRTFFRYLRDFTSDETEKERLDEFLSADLADELYDYCYRVRRTIQEVLSEFRNAQIPRDYIFDVFPPLRPRQFSIASSSERHPRSIHLCVAMVKYKTKLKVPRRGVCSTYLSRLQLAGHHLKIRVLKGFLQLPTDDDTPIICVGPGTGVAPMRAVIQERIQRNAYENTLYFGCRSAEKDQHYANEWLQYSADKALTYRVACSRDGPEGIKRTYVQDLITQDSERLWRLLDERGAYVFISGSSNKMPTAVKESLRDAVVRWGARSEEEASQYILDLERSGRLIEECWS